MKNDEENIIFCSSSNEKYIEFIKYYKRHPFKYIKLIEESYNIKLKFYQKILLFIPTKEQRKQKKIDKLLSKFINKSYKL